MVGKTYSLRKKGSVVEEGNQQNLVCKFNQ